jgi:O-antigen ligase
MAGGLVGVIFSWSRIAIATWVVVAALVAFLRAGILLRLAVVGAALLALFCLPLYGVDPFGDISSLRHSIDRARAGSSMARELIYQKSWEGFLNSPLIGHGWIGESVHPKEELPIGSHSTIYGLLYTGGLPTFLAFVVAMTATLLVQIGRWVQARTEDHRARIEIGVALTLCLLAFSPFEQIFSLTVPCLFMFLWIGACVGQSEYAEVPPSAAAPDAMPGAVIPRARVTALRQGRPETAPPAEIVRAFRPLRGRSDGAG